jgi:hypothetical protein
MLSPHETIIGQKINAVIEGCYDDIAIITTHAEDYSVKVLKILL